MTTCKECGQNMPQANAPREFVPIGAAEAFSALCRSLAAMPAADERNKTALSDLPKTVDRYKQLTVGQWKMFCAIHKQIMGTWPPDKAEFMHENAAPPPPDLPYQLDEVPF